MAWLQRSVLDFPHSVESKAQGKKNSVGDRDNAIGMKRGENLGAYGLGKVEGALDDAFGVPLSWTPREEALSRAQPQSR